MNTAIDFLSLAKSSSNWKLLQQLHRTILATSKNVEYRIFPIYIRYANDDKNIALLYFKGKHLRSDEIELGLNIGDAKNPTDFDNGKHMKYPGINCSIKLDASSKLTKKLIDTIKLTKN